MCDAEGTWLEDLVRGSWHVQKSEDEGGGVNMKVKSYKRKPQEVNILCWWHFPQTNYSVVEFESSLASFLSLCMLPSILQCRSCDEELAWWHAAVELVHAPRHFASQRDFKHVTFVIWLGLPKRLADKLTIYPGAHKSALLLPKKHDAYVSHWI